MISVTGAGLRPAESGKHDAHASLISSCPKFLDAILKGDCFRWRLFFERGLEGADNSDSLKEKVLLGCRKGEIVFEIFLHRINALVYHYVVR